MRPGRRTRRRPGYPAAGAGLCPARAHGRPRVEPKESRSAAAAPKNSGPTHARVHRRGGCEGNQGFLHAAGSPTFSVDLRHHVLDLRVVLERVGGQVLAVARLLVAAVRHLRDERDVVVDPDRPELELARRVQRAADVARPDRGGEAVVGRRSPRRSPRRRRRSAAPSRPARTPRAGRSRRPAPTSATTVGLTKKPRSPFVPPPVSTVAPFARSRKPSTRSCCDFEITGPISISSPSAGSPTCSDSTSRHELLEQLVVDLRPGDDPRGGGAVLARVPVAGDLDPLRDGGRVGVVEDEHRRLAAELEVDALERVRRGAGDLLAGRDVAGQRDEPHVRVPDDPRRRRARRRR